MDRRLRCRGRKPPRRCTGSRVRTLVARPLGVCRPGTAPVRNTRARACARGEGLTVHSRVARTWADHPDADMYISRESERLARTCRHQPALWGAERAPEGRSRAAAGHRAH